MSATPHLYVISGCSGGGKSTLIDALAKAGHHVVREPGRRIIAKGGPLPWDNLAGFSRAAIDMAEADYDTAQTLTGPVFFDRSLVDAVFALAHATNKTPDLDRLTQRRYATPVFMAPPWPELFKGDADRRHSLKDALAEHQRLEAAYPALGYRMSFLPQSTVSDRVAHVLGALS